MVDERRESPEQLAPMEVTYAPRLPTLAHHIPRKERTEKKTLGVLTNCDEITRGLELPEGDINGDTTLTLSLELVEHPRILEGALAEFSGFLLSELAKVYRKY